MGLSYSGLMMTYPPEAQHPEEQFETGVKLMSIQFLNPFSIAVNSLTTRI